MTPAEIKAVYDEGHPKQPIVICGDDLIGRLTVPVIYADPENYGKSRVDMNSNGVKEIRYIDPAKLSRIHNTLTLIEI